MGEGGGFSDENKDSRERKVSVPYVMQASPCLSCVCVVGQFVLYSLDIEVVVVGWRGARPEISRLDTKLMRATAGKSHCHS